MRYLRSQGLPEHGFTLIIPFSWLTLFSAVLPAIWLKRRTQRRRLPGLCPVCGYDLRATPTRCPECGASPQIDSDAAMPIGHPFWKPLLIALFISMTLMLLGQWIMAPKLLWSAIFSSFLFVWTISLLIGVAVAVMLRPAGGGRIACIASLVLFLLCALFALPQTIELYVAPNHLSNAWTDHGFVYILNRSRDAYSEFDCPQVRGAALIGFGWYHGTAPDGESAGSLILHIWPLTLLSAILPASWLVRSYRSRVEGWSKAADPLLVQRRG